MLLFSYNCEYCDYIINIISMRKKENQKKKLKYLYKYDDNEFLTNIFSRYTYIYNIYLTFLFKFNIFYLKFFK